MQLDVSARTKTRRVGYSGAGDRTVPGDERPRVAPEPVRRRETHATSHENRGRAHKGRPELRICQRCDKLPLMSGRTSEGTGSAREAVEKRSTACGGVALATLCFLLSACSYPYFANGLAGTLEAYPATSEKPTKAEVDAAFEMPVQILSITKRPTVTKGDLTRMDQLGVIPEGHYMVDHMVPWSGLLDESSSELWMVTHGGVRMVNESGDWVGVRVFVPCHRVQLSQEEVGELTAEDGAEMVTDSPSDGSFEYTIGAFSDVLATTSRLLMFRSSIGCQYDSLLLDSVWREGADLGPAMEQIAQTPPPLGEVRFADGNDASRTWSSQLRRPPQVGLAVLSDERVFVLLRDADAPDRVLALPLRKDEGTWSYRLDGEPFLPL